MNRLLSPNKRRKAVLLIESDPDNYLASSSGRRAFWSAFWTFNLAVMGSSVLPMPYAVSHTGAAIGLLIMVLVALCNDYTTTLMIDAVYETGHESYEALAQWAGGTRWKTFSQVILISLLWGPNSGGLSLMADVAQVMCDRLQGNTPAAADSALVGSPAVAAVPGLLPQGVNASAAVLHGWQQRNSSMHSILLDTTSASNSSSLSNAPWATQVQGMLTEGVSWLASGPAIMVLMTILVVFPLSCQKHMRSLEAVAAAGVVVVAGLCILLAVKACALGLPAVADGQLPLWSFKVTDELPEAFSLLGYAFYCQPYMMPIIREMPEGKAGRRALEAAVHAALLGSSFILYAGTGFFGAALFGANTYGNVMLNNITNSTAGCLVAYSCMLLYLAAGAAACQFPLRASVDLLILGEHAPMTTARSVVINGVTLGVSLAVALVTPGGAEKVYAVVGASGVCIVSYVLPVCIHIKLLRTHSKQQWWKQQRQQQALYSDAESSQQQLSAPLLTPHSSASSLTDLLAAAEAAAPSSSMLPSLTDHKPAGLAAHGSSLLLVAQAVASPAGYQHASGVCAPCCCWRGAWLGWIRQLLVPLSVMAIGIGFSIAAIWVAVANILWANAGNR